MPRKDNPELMITGIRISKETRDELNSLKIIPEELMESVIKRLIKVYEDVNKDENEKMS